MSDVPQMNDFVALTATKKATAAQGHICYIGPLIGDKYVGTYYGIQLDQAIGKNNGSLNDQTYFRCKDQCGLFVARNRIDRIITKHKSFEYRLELIIASFMHEASLPSAIPLEIYRLIFFYSPPQKLHFTKDQRVMKLFKVNKSRLRVSTPRAGVRAYKEYQNRDSKQKSKAKTERWEHMDSKIALLRFKDNSITNNAFNVIHQTFPIRHWKQCNFRTFELKLSLQCVSRTSHWEVRGDDDDGDEYTCWPHVVLLDAFQAQESDIRERKVWLNVMIQKKNVGVHSWQFGDGDPVTSSNSVSLFGERLHDAWRYWVVTPLGESEKIETQQAVEIGFQFSYSLGRWVGDNSNVEIVEQRWSFHDWSVDDWSFHDWS